MERSEHFSTMGCHSVFDHPGASDVEKEDGTHNYHIGTVLLVAAGSE